MTGPGIRRRSTRWRRAGGASHRRKPARKKPSRVSPPRTPGCPGSPPRRQPGGLDHQGGMARRANLDDAPAAGSCRGVGAPRTRLRRSAGPGTACGGAGSGGRRGGPGPARVRRGCPGRSGRGRRAGHRPRRLSRRRRWPTSYRSAVRRPPALPPPGAGRWSRCAGERSCPPTRPEAVGEHGARWPLPLLGRRGRAVSAAGSGQSVPYGCTGQVRVPGVRPGPLVPVTALVTGTRAPLLDPCSHRLGRPSGQRRVFGVERDGSRCGGSGTTGFRRSPWRSVSRRRCRCCVPWPSSSVR